MKIKPVFKNLYSRHLKRTKVFLLAGLMGGMYSCKDVLEPEMPEKSTPHISNAFYNNDTTMQNLTNDKFMRHLSDINGAQFYSMTESKFGFMADGMGNVNQLYGESFGDCNLHEEWLNWSCVNNITDINGQRIDDGSVDSVATFKMTKKYDFIVEGCFADPRENWRLYEVDEDSYNVLKNKTLNELAQMAWNHLTEVNADPGHRQNIYDAILQGKGVWKSHEDIVPIKTKGAKIGLQHSDIGFIQGDATAKNEPNNHEHYPYSGGVLSKRLSAPQDYVKYNGKAYAVINHYHGYKIDDLGHWGSELTNASMIATDSANATFAHGSVADTLIMPFNNWYTVKFIIHNNGQQIGYEFVNNTSGPFNIQNTADNNVSAEKSQTPIELDYYGAENGNGVSFIMSEPDYYGTNSDVATGLENVYCAPARRSKASDGATIPNEVIIHGGFGEEGFTSDTTKKEVVMYFIFGGLNQNQK